MNIPLNNVRELNFRFIFSIANSIKILFANERMRERERDRESTQRKDGKHYETGSMGMFKL